MQQTTQRAAPDERNGKPYGESTDSELIKEYNCTKSQQAFETLLRRHYNTIHKRLLMVTKNPADADDLSQKLWLRVLENLSNYKDKQKFPHFLNTIASNLLKDEWRRASNRNQGSLDQLVEDGNRQVEQIVDEEDLVSELGNRAEIDYLVRKLIPRLATKLRAVFLLKHESEYWDGKQPFQWQHLAELNDMDEAQTYQSFVNTRDALITANTSPAKLADDDRLIFLIWTQAQRLEKSTTQTETYLAGLLGIPVNTFKTRYRAALAELSAGLERWRSEKTG